MPADTAFVSALPGETRIALAERGRLVEVWVSRPGAGCRVGDVYLGRVEKVVPGLEAAFVDVGGPRAGFLALAEARPAGAGEASAGGAIGDFVSEGDAVLVQVTREASLDKGPKLTQRVVLAGLFASFDTGLPDGPVVRGRADPSGPDVGREFERLRAEWERMESDAKRARAPARLGREAGAIAAALLDGRAASVGRIVVDDADAFAEAKADLAEAAPELASGLELSPDWGTLFDAFGLEEQIEAALEPAVALPSGGRLVVAETAALAAIDVDTGAASGAGGKEEVAAAVNREAAAEIARQIRLRNLGGAIVVDFAPSRRPRARAAALRALETSLADDPVGVHVFGFTRLGLVEMTRPRRRPSLAETLTQPWPSPDGPGRARAPVAVAYAALRRLIKESRAQPGAAFSLAAPRAVVGAFEGEAREARRRVEAHLGRTIALVADETLAPDRFQVAARRR
jgi:ribonuclease G